MLFFFNQFEPLFVFLNHTFVLAQPIFMQIFHFLVLIHLFLLKFGFKGEDFALDFIVIFFFIVKVFFQFINFVLETFNFFQGLVQISLSWSKWTWSILVFVLFSEDNFFIANYLLFQLLNVTFEPFIFTLKRYYLLIAFLFLVQKFQVCFIEFCLHLFHIFWWFLFLFSKFILKSTQRLIFYGNFFFLFFELFI